MKSLFVFGAVAFLCCAIRPVAAAQLNTGAVVMTTTGGASSIALDISIADNGAAPGCTWFIILRDGVQVAVVARQPGVQNTLSYTDTNVQPDRLYWYGLRVSAFPVQIPTPLCDETAFVLAHGSSWGQQLDIPGHVGAGPGQIAHGKLLATANWPGAYMELCNTGFIIFEYGLPAGYEQYLGKDVLLYGEYVNWSVQNGWYLQPMSFALQPCPPIATQSVSWGHVKSLYR